MRNRGLLGLPIILAILLINMGMADTGTLLEFHQAEKNFQHFLTSLRKAAKSKDAKFIYSKLAPDYYICRDFGGTYDPTGTPEKNFSWAFQLDNTKLRPELQNLGWQELRKHLQSNRLERRPNGEICIPYGAQEALPFPAPQLCFRRNSEGQWLIAGYINGGD